MRARCDPRPYSPPGQREASTKCNRNTTPLPSLRAGSSHCHHPGPCTCCSSDCSLGTLCQDHGGTAACLLRDSLSSYLTTQPTPAPLSPIPCHSPWSHWCDHPPPSQAPLSERKDELTSSPAAWDHRTSRSAQHIPAPLLLQLGALTLRPYGLCCLTTHSCTSSTNLLLFPFLVLFTAHADPWWAISPAFVPPQLPSFFPSAPFCSTQRVTGSCFSTISLLQQAGGTSGQQKAHKEEAGLVGLRTAGSKASQAEGEFSQLISYTALCLEKL